MVDTTPVLAYLSAIFLVLWGVCMFGVTLGCDEVPVFTTLCAAGVCAVVYGVSEKMKGRER